MELDTTIYETAFHNLNDVLGIEGVTEIIYRERAVYNILCQGILLDFREQKSKYPQLISNDYSFTQQIGKRLANEGHPGLLAPSARKPQGVNVVAFTEKILSNPRISHYLSYYIDPTKKSVRVEKVFGSTYLDISFNIE